MLCLYAKPQAIQLVPFPLCPSIRLTQANGGREKRRDRRSEFCAHHDTVVIHSLYHKRRRRHSFVFFPVCWHLSFPSSGRGGFQRGSSSSTIPFDHGPVRGGPTGLPPLNERQSGMMLPPPQLLALAFSPAVEESERGGGKRKELVGSFVATFLLLPTAHLAPLSNCHGLQGHEETE